MERPGSCVRCRVTVSGIVQGVGFRPYVHVLAHRFGLSGWVENNGAGVSLEVQGAAAAVAAFVDALPRQAPPLASIEALTTEETPPVLDAPDVFRIVESRTAGAATTLVSPDVAPCADCLAEIRSPSDRRAGYAFTNCTNCGPRYSIVTGIPYDRPNTTMAGFPLCPDCRREYGDPVDRRFHAQPVCCPACGPRLSPSVDEAVAALLEGQILAVKGLGGYHLAVRAADESAVIRLRQRKQRDDKPFAVMVADIDGARRLCRVPAAEQAMLCSPARPIVLLERRPDAPVAQAVAPGFAELGLMLPSTPLHQLLLDGVGEAIVCTSGNTSDEPIAYRDDDAARRLALIADQFLVHDRPIHIRVDDSVGRVVDGRPYLIRRSRGYVPAPVGLPWAAARPVLACGADLKNTVAVARGRHVFLSHHIGDLHQVETHKAYGEAVDHLCRLFEVRPEVVAHDLHPQYASTAYGTDRADAADLVPVVVQHHHAHIASCLADNGLAGPVIGVAFDGLGYGDDGTLWGGEFLIADLVGYRRAAWFAPVPLPGGDRATRQPWRMAAAYLDAAGLASDLGPVAGAPGTEPWDAVLQLGRSGLASPLTSSVGRLFDAVAALLGVRSVVSYEGQAAIELEQLADRSERGTYEPAALVPAEVPSGLPGSLHGLAGGSGSAGGPGDDGGSGGLVVAGPSLVAAVVADQRRGVDPGLIAARFHRGLAATVVAVCQRLREAEGLSTVALSGGVFLNTLLLGSVVEGLQAQGFEVLCHRQVPCNDGGISLGQAAVAAARDRAGVLP